MQFNIQAEINMKETLRKIDIITLCLVIIVVNLAYCYAQLKVFDKDYVNFFGYTIFQVITGSMEDTRAVSALGECRRQETGRPCNAPHLGGRTF